MRKRFSWLTHFNWRIMLMRIVIYAISLVVIALLIPNIYFAERSLLILLLASIALGFLSAIVKPLIQFLTFQIIFASYGIVIVFINAMLLWLLSVLFPQWFQVSSIFWALVGGALLGVVTSFLEALFGLSIPIVPAEDIELRALIKQGRGRDALNRILEEKEGVLEADVDINSLSAANTAPAGLSDDADSHAALADSDSEPVVATPTAAAVEDSAGHVASPPGNDVEPTSA
ncbi:MAG: phage holin family protein [Anaerolineae bacterium]|nr:phage holin family protein [Anaerolineae bacterium]MCB0204444.1 phage holin family protein [Anaerolineae bacterium]